MNFFRTLLPVLTVLATPVFASVTVTSPANGATVTSPTLFSATGSASTCATGVAAMGVYVNNQLAFKQNGASLSTSLTLSPGKYSTVVTEWDKCGGASSTPIAITVGSGQSTPGGINVSSPAANSTVTSPVTFSATAGSSTCASGVSAVGIYVGGALKYKVNGATMNTSLAFASGKQSAVVQEWDKCGGAANVTVPFTVGTSTTKTTVSLSASPTSISSGASSTLTVSASNATTVTLAGSDGSSFSLSSTGGSQAVAPTATTTYTASATGSTGTVTATAVVSVSAPGKPTISFSASPASIAKGAGSTLNWTTGSATSVSITGNDGSSYPGLALSGSQAVTPANNTTYTLTAAGDTGTSTATTAISVVDDNGVQAIKHVVFLLQENHSFDNYFGMLNPYRAANNMDVGDDGVHYSVDGLDDKLTKIKNENDEGTYFSPFKLKSTCVDDMTSAWIESFGDISRYNFTPQRKIAVDGFVHTGENFARTCAASHGTRCSGSFTDLQGKRSMGYYDQGFLNYYYYMASQFAVSDRWFSPVASKSIPNRIATFTGGTTNGLAYDPGNDDHLGQLPLGNIFSQLDKTAVPWKIYYTVTQGSCLSPDDCQGSAGDQFPATNFSHISASGKYLYENPSKAACVAPTVASGTVGDKTNSYCVDPKHIAPLSTYYTDLTNGTLPAFAFIEAGYGHSDEHPGSGQSILAGQAQVAKLVNAFMNSPMWSSSVFFLSYDEGGGPYDHVPPVPGHSNDFTSATVGDAKKASIPDIASISVAPDTFKPCVSTTGSPTTHCDLKTSDPGANAADAPAIKGFGAQIGFRVPNLVISPFVRKHYVSHIPMDHTAILKFVENRFIGPSAHITARDAAQPSLLDFFDFGNTPWATPPNPPAPVTPASLGYDPCTPATF